MIHFSFAKILFLIPLFLSLITGFSQNQSTKPLYFSLNYRSGENVPHREIIKNLRYPYRGIDFKIGWQTIGEKDWQIAYRNPSLGVGVNWNTFETEILGEPIAVYFFTSFPQITTRWCRLDLEVDLGLSHGINPYNELTNPTNFSTGTSINSIFGLYLEQSFHILPLLDLFVSEGISHYSNGALGWPNLGLNIPSLKFGVRYLSEVPKYINVKEKPKVKRNFFFVTYFGCGTKKLYAPTPSYNELLVSPSLYYRAGFKRRVGLGFEIAYNEAIKGSDINKKYTTEELMTFAIHLSHEFIISKFTILSQFGIYLKNQPTDKFYFERIGFGYYFAKNVRIVLNVKAHKIKAEYVEAGLTYDLSLN
jgi:hypothetical protein